MTNPVNQIIRGFCRMNIDDCKCLRWPEKFCAVPRKGEVIESICGTKQLTVCRVVHGQDGDGPYIDVELTRGTV